MAAKRDQGIRISAVYIPRLFKHAGGGPGIKDDNIDGRAHLCVSGTGYGRISGATATEKMPKTVMAAHLPRCRGTRQILSAPQPFEGRAPTPAMTWGG